MTTVFTPGFAHLASGAARLAAPAIAILLAACAGRTEPAAAPTAAGAAAPAAEAHTIRQVLNETVALELTLNPLEGSEARLPGSVVQGQDTRLRLALTDPRTGAPLRNIRPIAWMDRRSSAEATPIEQCRQKVAMYLQGKLYPSRAVKAHADVDLNSFYVIALTHSNHIAVIDPILSFNRTQMYTTVPLDSRGEDWALDREERRLYVTMPAVDRVAVVNTDTWRIAERLDVGATPTRVALQPDGTRFWVTTEPADAMGGISVVDAATRQVRGRIETGRGPHAVAFSPDGRRVFVSNKGSGTVSVIDAERFAKISDVATGKEPVDLAISPLDGRLYVAHEGDGTLAVLDVEKLSVVARHRLQPGLRTIRFPQPFKAAQHAEELAKHADHADDHANHDEHDEHAGHEAQEPAQSDEHTGHSHGVRGAERFGYAVNPRTNRLYVIDASEGTIIRNDSLGNGPDQVTFAGGYAYIRSLRTSEVAIIPLANPLEGGSGLNFSFPAGTDAPDAGAAPAAAAAALTTTMGMHEAVLVPNAKERRIYQYHYMPSMMMPMVDGTFSTFAFEPRAVLTVRRGLHEAEPGVYSATVRLPEEGNYDLIFLLDDPRLMQCVGGITALPDPALHEGEVALKLQPLSEDRTLRPGENELRFRLTDELTGRILTDLQDVTVLATTPGSGRNRALARPAEDGIYTVQLSVPAAAIYYVTVDVPSLRVSAKERPVVIFRGGPMAAQSPD